jgi:hypothetical protein
LVVRRPVLGRDVVVSIDGREVARFPKPTGERPWEEHALSHDGSWLVLALEVRPDLPIGSRLFVDGKEYRGGESIQAWRDRAPRPRDRFEQFWGGWPFMSWLGRIVLALLVTGPFVAGSFDGHEPRQLVAAMVGLGVVVVYELCLASVVRSLINRPHWPSRARSIIVVGVAVLLPMLALELSTLVGSP